MLSNAISFSLNANSFAIALVVVVASVPSFFSCLTRDPCDATCARRAYTSVVDCIVSDCSSSSSRSSSSSSSSIMLVMIVIEVTVVVVMMVMHSNLALL